MGDTGAARPGGSDGSDEVTRHLLAWAARAECAPREHAAFPPELIRAARRFVVATGVHGLPEEQVALVPTDAMAVGQLVVQLVRRGETVDARTVRERLVATGRVVPMSTVAAALHRACRRRGSLEHVALGRYRRPSEEVAPTG